MTGRAALLALVVLLGTGCGGAAQPARGAAPSSRPASSPGSSPVTIQLVPPSVVPNNFGSSGLPAPGGVTASRASPPVRLRIPAIGVDSSLLQLDARPDGTIEVPSDFDKPGWYSRGPAPGENGPAVVLGHLDSYTGPAVFYRLSSLHAGDTVTVNRADGSELAFKVQRLASYPTDNFPTSEVYGATPAPELRLITCGGNFSVTRHQYLANVVAFAALAS